MISNAGREKVKWEAKERRRLRWKKKNERQEHLRRMKK